MFEDDVKIFKKFQEQMIFEIDGRNYVYGDSWKHLKIEQLEERLTHKLEEYNLTKNPKKLVSLANLAMLIFIRKGGLK